MKGTSPRWLTQKFFHDFRDRSAVWLICLIFALGLFIPLLRLLAPVPYLGAYIDEMGQFLPQLRYRYPIIVEVDCIGYYSYLRSLVVDGDLDFENDFALFGWPRRAKEKSPTGLTTNPWGCGPAILWAPAFLLAQGVSLAGNFFGADLPLNGQSPIFDFFIITASMFYGLIGLLLIYYFLRFFFSPWTSFWSVTLYFFASPLVFYQYHEPTMSHVLTVAAAAAYIYWWYRTLYRKTFFDHCLLGLVGALIAMIRPQDVFFFLLPTLGEFVVLIKQDRSVARRYFFGSLAQLAVFFIGFSPQMAAWQILYGSFLTIPQGSGWMQWGNPQLLPLLLSTNHGLITYTPLLLFCLVGLLFFNKQNRDQWLLAVVFSAIFLLEFYINAAAGDWQAGWAFGARRFLSCSIIFAWGLANFWNFLSQKRFWLIIARFGAAILIIFNLLFCVQWIYGLIPREGTLNLQQYFWGKWEALILIGKVLKETWLILFS